MQIENSTFKTFVNDMKLFSRLAPKGAPNFSDELEQMRWWNEAKRSAGCDPILISRATMIFILGRGNKFPSLEKFERVYNTICFGYMSYTEAGYRIENEFDLVDAARRFMSVHQGYPVYDVKRMYESKDEFPILNAWCSARASSGMTFDKFAEVYRSTH